MSKNGQSKTKRAPEQKSVRKATLRRVLSLLRPYRALILLSAVLALIATALSLSLPILIGRAIDLAAAPGAVDFPGIFRLIGISAAAILLCALCNFLVGVCNNRAVYHIAADLRAQLFGKLQRLPLSYLDAHPQGDIVSRTVNDTAEFADGLLLGFTQIFTGVLTILATFVFMLLLDWKIALTVLLLTPLSLLVARFIGRHTYEMFRERSRITGEQTAYIDETLSGEKVVLAFGGEEDAVRRFDDVNDRLGKCSLRAVFFSSLVNPTTRFVNSTVYAAVAFVGSLTAILTVGGASAFSVGTLVTMLAYTNQYTKPFNEISGVLTELENALACAARVFALLDESEEIPDEKDALDLGEAGGRVELSDVSFSYLPEQRLIEDLSLRVSPGEKIAIVGPTGCGKTTLINLLMRFYDVKGGAVLVDGQDIRRVTRESLRRNYGMVLQETWLKTATVRENLAFGRPDATDGEIVAAAKAAHAHAFIMQLPDGYDTVLGGADSDLSQGQRQLLCIARVMLARPTMLILDEATSSIDTRTERQISRAFSEMMQGRTSFIVAHRLSTILDADLILVMRDGRVVEQGRHEELLAKGGFYAKLYHSQFSA